MSDAQYLAAIKAAKEFIDAAEAAQCIRSEIKVGERSTIEHMTTGTKECGEAKRRSMTLTRQLARFRKGLA